MPRIRTIKPEFWDSPSTAQASAVARLAFIGMWNWADDHGRGTANLKELEGFIFPNDDISSLSGGTSENFRDVVKEVCEAFGVKFYSVQGRPYYEIPSWDDHQRTERKAKSKYPASNEGESHPDMGKHTESRKIAEIPRTSGAGIGEEGKRGRGEQLTILVNADASTDQPTDDRDDTTDTTDTTPAPTKRKTSPYTKEFLEWWEHYPRRVSKGEAFKAWKQIPDRDLAALTAGADRYANDPNRTEEFTKHPASWLRGRCWEDEDPLPQRGRDVRPAIATTDQRMMQAQALKQTGGQPQWNATRSLTY